MQVKADREESMINGLLKEIKKLVYFKTQLVLEVDQEKKFI